MRFIDRALNALRYHRRAYAVLGVLAAAMAGGGILFATAATMNQANLTGFKHRLTGLNQTAGKSLQRAVVTAYTTIGRNYDAWWWGVIALALLVAISFGLVLAHWRRQETTAYLLMGKPTWNITAQAILEALLVFSLGYWLVAAALSLAVSPLTTWLQNINQRALTHTLSTSVTPATFTKITTKLFAHRVTAFNGSGLMAPHPGAGPLTLAGVWVTYLSGLAAWVLGIGSSTAVATAWRKHRLIHHSQSTQ